jgi:thiol-disulfide isomerase/thioredoxin
MPLLTLLRALLVSGFVVSALCAEPTPNSSLTISHGEKINIGDYLVEGKTVIFGFYSTFSAPCPCAPCSAMADPLEELQKERPDLVVVKVDVDRPDASGIDWNSPVVQQFSLRRLPHFKIYGPTGALEAQDDQKSNRSPALAQVHAMVEALGAHKS